MLPKIGKFIISIFAELLGAINFVIFSFLMIYAISANRGIMQFIYPLILFVLSLACYGLIMFLKAKITGKKP